MFFFLISNFINLSINSVSEEYKLNEIDVPKYIVFNNTEKEKYISFNLEFVNISSLIDSSYIHFSTFSNLPLNLADKNGQQIIYSSTEECPSTSNAERYSFKYLKNTDLFINFPNATKIYLTIKCFKYPCSFNLKTQIEKDYAHLNIYDTTPYSYSYFASEQITNTMKFKIPSSLYNSYPNYAKHLLTISVSNPNDPDYTKLYLNNGNNTEELKMDSYKTRTNMIFSLIEENNINELSDNIFYVLEIESMENQFISISIKPSIYFINEYKLNSEIMPNSHPQYSFLNLNSEDKTKEECYKINEQYISDNLDNINENDLLYASIDYFTSPSNIYLKYKKEEIQLSQSSMNLILQKESGAYPEICFYLKDNNDINEGVFKLEMSHLSNNNENYDVFNPLLTGFFHKKMLNKNGLSFFTYNSDVHYYDKITYYLKPLKGNPEIFIDHCEDYPNCNKDISQLKNDNKVIKPKIINNIYSFYSYTYYTNRAKDLSPYYPKQNLLYAYCPETEKEYCQFEILIYSNLDEIVLSHNSEFYSNLKKDELDLYKIHLPKGNDEIKKIQIFLHSNENVELISENMNNITIKKDKYAGTEIYEYIPDKLYYIHKNDFDILFSIKANNDAHYYIKYLIVNNKDEEDNENTDCFMGKMGLINETKYKSLKMYYPLPNKKENNKPIFNDFVFNFYLKYKNSINTNNTALFDEFEIKSSIITNKNFISLVKTQNNEDFNQLSLNTKLFDLSTKSVIISIKKEDLENTWINNNKDDEELLLFIELNKNKNYNNYSDLYGKFFLVYKNNTEFIIPTNNYISDQLYIDKNSFNLYHLQSEGEGNNIFQIEFSSNYALENKVFEVLFIDYDNITNIKPENFKNTIKFNNKKLGGINYFEFELNGNKKDIVLCVIFKGEKKEKEDLKTINYVFRYKTYKKEDENKIANYAFNDKFKYTNKNNKTILHIEKVKKNNEYVLGDIYIRKILNTNKLKKEEINTIAIIESKYELVNGNITDKNKSLEIEIPKINETDYYSILINFPNDEQNFAYVFKSEKTENKTDNKLFLIIVIAASAVAVIIIIIVIVIILLTKKQGSELKEKVMQTSFKESGVVDDLLED